MASGDIVLFNQSVATGAKRMNVAASATTIKPGEPVVRAAAAVVVTPAVTNTPNIGTTDPVAGIAVQESTNTASAAGYVMVQPVAPNQIWLISPKVASTWDTQSEYDALVGKRVLIDLTSSTYTLLAADSTNNGCVVEWLDVSKHPGKVAFSFRSSALDLT